MEVQKEDNESEMKNLLGEQKVKSVKTYLKRRWTKLGLCYRLCALALGMSMSLIFSGGVLRNNPKLALMFFCVMIGAIISAGKQLKEIYVLDEAQNCFTSKYGDFGQAEKGRKSALAFGKRLTLIGNVLGGYVGAFLAPIVSKEQQYIGISERLVDMVTGIITTAWIAVLLIAICQFFDKRYAKKHVDKAESMADVILEETSGDAQRAKEMRKVRRMPGRYGMQIGCATIALCLVGNYLIIRPSLQEKENKQVSTVIENLVNENEKKEDTGKVENTEDTATEGHKEEQEKETVNPNGYGFSIGQDCLNVYLEYIAGGLAASEYEIEEVKNVGGDWGHHLGYFSIAGMAGDEPFLLLSSTIGNGCGDEVYFVTYTPSFAGVGNGQAYMQGNWGIENCDSWSLKQFPVIDTLYVCTSGKNETQQFIHRQEVEYADKEGHDIYTEALIYDDGDMTNSKKTVDFDKALSEGTIAEIK